MQVRSLGQEDPLEEEVITCSSILTWKIPRTEKPDGLQSMGSQRVGHTLVSRPLHMLVPLPRRPHLPMSTIQIPHLHLGNCYRVSGLS